MADKKIADDYAYINSRMREIQEERQTHQYQQDNDDENIFKCHRCDRLRPVYWYDTRGRVFCRRCYDELLKGKP